MMSAALHEGSSGVCLLPVPWQDPQVQLSESDAGA